jgi:hypothetical protein
MRLKEEAQERADAALRAQQAALNPQRFQPTQGRQTGRF